MESYLFKVSALTNICWHPCVPSDSEIVKSAATRLLGRVVRSTIQQIKVTKIYR